MEIEIEPSPEPLAGETASQLPPEVVAAPAVQLKTPAPMLAKFTV
jgi:hypothetical protein